MMFLYFILFAMDNNPQWSTDQAWSWYESQPWLVGCNFIPSTAINQLEMWQADTFDINTIDRELGWAQSIGMNVVRVYLHELAWLQDEKGFFERIEKFLTICDRHNIKPMFVFFDDCWNENAQIGKQPEPKPGVHNSGWLQCPGVSRVKDKNTWEQSKKYLQNTMKRFANDERILAWDLYNEPGNSGSNENSTPFLDACFEWAWEIRPSQPLTVGAWGANEKIDEITLSKSDIVTGHSYSNLENTKKAVNKLKEYGRPVIVTEWMARTLESRVETHLPFFKEAKVGCINWGLVKGKTNTIFPWGSPEGAPEPELWFHDLFHSDGKAYREGEIEVFKRLTKE
jgi:hypothetical protein